MKWLDLRESPFFNSGLKQVIERGIEAERALVVFKTRFELKLKEIEAFQHFRTEFLKILHQVLALIKKNSKSDDSNAFITDLKNVEILLVGPKGEDAIDRAKIARRDYGMMLNQVAFMEKLLYSVFLQSINSAIETILEDRLPKLVATEMLIRGGLIPQFKELAKSKVEE